MGNVREFSLRFLKGVGIASGVRRSFWNIGLPYGDFVLLQARFVPGTNGGFRDEIDFPSEFFLKRRLHVPDVEKRKFPPGGFFKNQVHVGSVGLVSSGVRSREIDAIDMIAPEYLLDFRRTEQLEHILFHGDSIVFFSKRQNGLDVEVS